MPPRHPVFLVLLASAATSVFLWRGGVLPIRDAFANPKSHYDYRSVYFGAIDLLAGHEPCRRDPERPSVHLAERLGLPTLPTVYYPMALGTLYAPFALLPFDQSRAAWVVFKLVLLAASALLLGRLAAPPGAGAPWAALVVLLCAAFETTVREISIGQANLVILLLLALAATALAAGREWGAGAALGAALLVKPNPVMAAASFALRGRWRPLAGLVLVVVGVTALTVAVYGLAPVRSCLETTATGAGKASRWWANQSLTGILLHVGVANPFSTPWFDSMPAVRILWLAAALAIAGTAAAATLRRPRPDPVLSFSLWLTAGLVIGPRAWDHYWVWLLLPIVLVARAVLDGRVSPWLALVTYALLAFPGQYWHVVPALHHGPLLLVTASQTWGACLLFWILLRLHPARPASAS